MHTKTLPEFQISRYQNEMTKGLFGSRPGRQLAGQAAISAPGARNRTPGSAAWARQLCAGPIQTTPKCGS